MTHGPSKIAPEVDTSGHAGLADVRARMNKAIRDAGRKAGSVELIAVSKTYDAQAIEPVISAGQMVFGENRVQEAKAKWPQLRQKYNDIRLHLIGPLQTNKARDAVALFDAIQTLDRDKLAKALAYEIGKQGRHIDLFVQINTGAEPQKAGVLPEDADDFLDRCQSHHGLSILGLMCIPPIDENPSLHFALLEKIAKRNNLDCLSMGMSGDFEDAIAFGATHIRVGSAIFGTRNYKTA